MLRLCVWLILVTCVPNLVAAESTDDSLVIVRNAHAQRVHYEVRSSVMAPASLKQSSTPEVRGWYEASLISRQESERLGVPVISIGPRVRIGNARGDARFEWGGVGHGGDAARSTTVAIWTANHHIEGPMSRRAPSTYEELGEFNVESEREFRASAEFRNGGVISSPLMRAYNGGYVEIARYAIAMVDGFADTEFEHDEDSSMLRARSELLHVAIDADARTGEIVRVTMEIGAGQFRQYQYEGRLPETILPARIPNREFIVQFKPGDAPWWAKQPRPDPSVVGYIVNLSATATHERPELFEWHDSNWDASSAAVPEGDSNVRDRPPKVEPIFVPSKTAPGRVVPNAPTSKTKVLLLAAGASLVLAGSVLIVRRRLG